MAPPAYPSCRSRQQDPTRHQPTAHPPPHCRHNAAPPVKRRRQETAQKERKKFYIGVRTPVPVLSESLQPRGRRRLPFAAGRRPPNKRGHRVVTSSLKPPPECTPAAPRTPRCTLHLIKTWIKSKTVSHATSQSRRRHWNMRGGRRHIHLHTPGTGSRRRRAAAWRGTLGAEVAEEIQTGSWLWGPDGVQLSGPTV